jgi:hypothetical protein
MQDVTSELGDLIAKSKTFGNSENIRCGKYKFLIKKVYAQAIDNDKGTQRFAFVELKTLESAPNPQHRPTGVPEASFDSGMTPNVVGSTPALKVNFDGPGAKSAGSNIKNFILGLFGLSASQTSDDNTNSTWNDLARQKDLRIGDATGIDTTTNKVILATKAKRANPASGMIIACTASMKEKKKTKLLPPAEKEYVTICQWECVAKPGTGDNTVELIAQRRAEIEALAEDDELDDAPPSAPPAPPASAPPPPPAAFVPPPPWRVHTDVPFGNTPDTRWYWDGATGVKNETQLKNGA